MIAPVSSQTSDTLDRIFADLKSRDKSARTRAGKELGSYVRGMLTRSCS